MLFSETNDLAVESVRRFAWEAHALVEEMFGKGMAMHYPEVVAALIQAAAIVRGMERIRDAVADRD